MLNPSIRETLLTPRKDGGFAVQLHISDAGLGDEDAAFVLKLHVEIPPPRSDRLIHVQREALLVGSEVLRRLVTSPMGAQPPPRTAARRTGAATRAEHARAAAQ